MRRSGAALRYLLEHDMTVAALARIFPQFMTIWSRIQKSVSGSARVGRMRGPGTASTQRGGQVFATTADARDCSFVYDVV